MEPIDRLDRYLNNELPPDEKTRLETDLRQDTNLQQLLDNLTLSQRAVQLGTIRADVATVRAEFVAQYRRDEDNEETGAKIIPLNSRASRSVGWVTRIAASVSLLLLAYGGYRVATTDGPTLYADAYVSYQLPTSRGTDAPPSPLDARYRAGDYAGVVDQARTLPRRTPPDLFLEAMAHLQLAQYRAAVIPLEQAQQANKALANPVFEPEIEYYLAMAYLGDNQYARAATLLDAIDNNPQNPYRDLVSKTDLWLLKLKK